MPHACSSESKFTVLALWSREIKNLLLDLDAYGDAGPDGIFPLFLKETIDAISTKIAVIICKCARIEISTCWRFSKVSLVSMWKWQFLTF